ncbi:MAG TPA: hypothetical protein VN956_10355 [Pyrinomonadaceae bacterium]|nr:hypothetical protein [Pyrinomonadaceae bacterium]
MAEFDDIRQQLGKARADSQASADEVARARERLRAVARRETELKRVFNPQDEARQQEQESLLAERSRAEEQLKASLTRQARTSQDERAQIDSFAAFNDPRKGIENFNDATPILLMPVRLETRFKTTVGVPGLPATNQLWVRVYPDDCWIDSFDPVLTETEVANATTYWTGVWKAGGIEDQERAAWRTLVGSHGSGRAAWIISQFQPLNLSPAPLKPRPQDVVLAIVIQTSSGSVADALAATLFRNLSPGTPIEAATNAVSTFWRDVWLADGAGAQMSDAQTVLENVVGQLAAQEIITKFQPVNFADPLPNGITKNQVNVSVALLMLPIIDTKESAWSRAPKVNLLPDRFVFIGYEGENATIFEIGNPVPSELIVGPDPSAPKEQQLQPGSNGAIIIPDEMKWMTDFDRAVEVGMGFRINLTPAQARGGFSRVLVVGLRLSADEKKAKTELETLFRHHCFSRKGLAVVTQGTPTNNTEAVGSGFNRLDDPDESFDDLKSPLFSPDTGWLDKKDGQWLAEYLGIDPEVFEHVHNAGAPDQLTERAMNMALWPATLGYWMESMMAPVFTRNGIEETRDFFNRYVLGSGSVPAIRIGLQPYGILPATTYSRMNWINQRQFDDRLVSLGPTLSYLQRLYPILKLIAADWQSMANDVSFVGKSGDPHKLLLDIVGLHPGSVEWSQRYAESFATVFNRLNLAGFGGFFAAIFLAIQRENARQLIFRLGGIVEFAPPILDKLFYGNHAELKGGVVDDKPLSETEAIRAYTDAGQNYVQWLIDAARTSLDALYAQDGFKDDKPPTAILYLLLRHALQLGYHDASIRVNEDAGLLSAQAAANARIDDPFLHIRENTAVSESRYQPLYAVAPAITASNIQPLHEFITASLSNLKFASYLREQLAALERLKGQPTARLERAFADHIDCCSYRLDAWFLGIVAYQLNLMRNIRERKDSPVRPGIYLGAYAWLENLKPENKPFTPVELRDPDLIKDFESQDEPPLRRDSTNEGYIHAPSLNHAVAAAVLRNGFISNASPENRQTMAINLTSERVRTALAMLEGVRGGQSLADLLGYQFERGLHDRHNLAEVDQVIFKLRRAFPLRGNRMNSTQPPEGVSIEAIEARNVIDGLALVEQMKTPGNNTYPFGKSGLPNNLSQAQLDAINAEADRVLESHDAVADLALSEGVYQAVLGNYDRVASTYDAYARGNFPPEPDVIRTPLNGISLTHRVALHLAAGADPTVSPIAGVAPTPRAHAEPALNNWLAQVLPELDRVGCTVAFRRAANGLDATETVTLRDLKLQPADIVAVLQQGNDHAMSELDDRILRHAVENFGPRPDFPISIRYMEAPQFSVFQLIPLVRNLRRLVTRSRALKATDLALMNEASSQDDSQLFIDIARLQLVRGAMDMLRSELAAFQTQLEGPLSDLDHRKNEIVTQADQNVDNLVALLARAATFSVAQSGWGFAYDFKRRGFSAILKRAFDPEPPQPGQVKQDLITRWTAKLNEFDARLADEAALPVTATDAERFSLLTQAERAISTVATSPLPASPAAFRSGLVTVKRVAFVAKRDQFATLQDTTRTKVSELLADVEALLPVSDFDSTEYSTAAHEDEIVIFTQDAVSVLKVITAELGRRISSCDDLFVQHAGTTDPAAQVNLLEKAAKSLLGSDFRIFPKFSLDPAQGDEIENAHQASQSGDLFQFLTSPSDPNLPADDFPVDTWLYGVARVREKMRAWEQTVIFAGGLSRPEPELVAMQFPFVPGERWLGLEFPQGQKLDHDCLLYTAHFATPFNKANRQCGMLLDEWTELIPTSSVDTGMTFHHDRPNNEAPQAMLLVTPSSFRGAWQWDDLIDALIETLAFAKLRAVEPRQIDQTPYAMLLPATIMASQISQLTIAANLALNNQVAQAIG